ncbi:ribonuclease III [Candidatus Daviesbacteria bacterium]|nr:ribonuclease III [Candidatus Daviesbacteria bacterium]
MFNEDLLKKKIYQTAFTHRSFLNENKKATESNERLEFLGDSVLSLIISSFLYNSRPQDAEGDLTNLRSFIVKTQSLAKAARSLDLGKFLGLSKGEEMSGGRENTQILANTFEAFLGAIYLDQGLEAARRFIEDNLLPFFTEELKSGPPKDAKSMLQELTQTKTKQSPKYKIIQTFGPDHAKEFKVGAFLQNRQIGEGSGPSKQVAEEQAANKALDFFTKQD